MGILQSLFGKKTNYKELVANGAVILDVRTSQEFKSGNLQGSINIPLQEINNQLSKLDKQKVIITCCASGMRSASAKSILTSKGYEVYNGGGWTSLKAKI